MPEKTFKILEEAEEIATYISELESLCNAAVFHIKDHLDVFSVRELKCMRLDQIISDVEYEKAVYALAEYVNKDEAEEQ